MLDQLKAQLEEFRKEEEARWRYEAEELERQQRLLEEMEPSDAEIKSELTKAGINVSAVEEESDKSARQLERVHKDLLQVEPPPLKRHPRESIIVHHVDSLLTRRPNPWLPECTWIYPPAYDGWGVSELCNFNLDLGAVNSDLTVVGSGWANSLRISHACTLWFYYFPPSAGELFVAPFVDFQGNVAVSADDKWYTSTHAELRLQLHFDLYQHYWDGEQIETIINEHRHNSTTAYWVDRTVAMPRTLSVSANDIVWIKLAISQMAYAKSNRAYVDSDFRTGANRRIRVERIRVCLHPLAT